jgi:hypothetical protein
LDKIILWRWSEMYNSIFETVEKGSNTMHLVVSDEDYFLSYESLSEEATQDLVNNYFKFRGRDGVPRVVDVDHDRDRNRIKITIDVDYEREYKLEPMSIYEIGDEGSE